MSKTPPTTPPAATASGGATPARRKNKPHPVQGFLGDERSSDFKDDAAYADSEQLMRAGDRARKNLVDRAVPRPLEPGKK